jgi:hypothetical protein
MRYAETLWVSSLAALVACGGTGYVPPPEFPRFKIDEPASQLSVRLKSGQPIDDVALGKRSEVAEILGDLSTAQHGSGEPLPARFKVDMVVDAQAQALAATAALLLPLFGVPIQIIVADVDLTFEVASKRYRGSGRASVVAGFYYNLTGGTTVRRATERAFKDAIERGPRR